ncbi:MBL fold metallo-hydrolase [Sphaerotilus microaerophilus]|jgi:glyoxylase-like metal-dependent hydrolase (beta-lactamase superfamily II)|uniref:MBL fold metallo-hydrolase n=1 Tax=Sphaerotilus microaerophilus TaxID=2914710 RepID=A0ABN6PI41_9BURK|nr:MBL fold metallo-hydrolase [Sphaerotilus sp. FB-5]BDI04671.1 MBL fold metallo-hydrolase [Sphaerotilus sp. FB-5]
MSAPTHFQTHADGLYVIDTGFERDLFDAAYLLVSPEGRAAFIDTGHNAAVPRLLATLAALGLRVEAVDWVIPTHVHLDHAGGAGLLMEQLPNARALIHPRGARHLVNPLALVEGARAVYGAEVVKATYGDIRPIPAERVVESHDDMTVQLGSRALRLIDTPGHARHHHCIWDEASRGWFTGDTFGISYREFDSAAGPWLFPTTTPVQFEPAAMRVSVQRMLAAQPQVIFPTHFGPITALDRVTAQFNALLDTFESGGLALRETLQREGRYGDKAAVEDALMAFMQRELVASALASGAPLDEARARELLRLDATLNAQGMAVWLAKAG